MFAPPPVFLFIAPNMLSHVDGWYSRFGGLDNCASGSSDPIQCFLLHYLILCSSKNEISKSSSFWSRFHSVNNWPLECTLSFSSTTVVFGTCSTSCEPASVPDRPCWAPQCGGCRTSTEFCVLSPWLRRTSHSLSTSSKLVLIFFFFFLHSLSKNARPLLAVISQFLILYKFLDFLLWCLSGKRPHLVNQLPKKILNAKSRKLQ